MKFFLIGYMGAGKSTIGKYVTRHVEIPFFDLDQEIERRSGKTVRELFEAFGEERFRLIERDTLREVAKTPGPWLMACGGGTPCFHQNMDFMNAQGTTIYLDLSAARLSIRLKNAKDDRPLLKGITGDLQVFIHKRLMERAPFYAMAHYILPEDFADKKGTLTLVQKVLAEGSGHF